MRAWDVDLVVRFGERGMGGDTLRAWHNKFAGTGTSQTYKCKKEFKVTTTGEGKVFTCEELKTGLHRIGCLEVGLVYWYLGVIVNFYNINRRNGNCIDKKTW